MRITHSPTRAVGGMVAAAHPLAAAAGADILRSGGNAFDAAVATVSTLNVVEPFMSGLAGLGSATCWVASENKVRCLDFIPPVPAKFVAAHLDKKDINGGASASGVPGNLAGWCALLERYGSRSIDEVLGSAIQHAVEGFPVSSLYAQMAKTTMGHTSTAEWKRVYASDGYNNQPGWILKQPDLASTFEAIASEGSAYLYSGALGETMISHLRKLGGCMTMADLESVVPEWQEPISGTYRDLAISVPPPPAESFQFLLTMRILDGFDFLEMEHLSADHLDCVFRSIRLSAETRILNNNKSISQINELLDGTKIQELRSRVRELTPVTGRTEQFGDKKPEDISNSQSHTTSVSIGDKYGNMICLTQSLGSPWGSTVVIPNTGVCMNNFMNWGDLNPSSPNFLIGGKRWAMCLSPSISTRQGQPVLALGTPGSYGIMQTQAQAMIHHVDYGLNLRQAIEAPRGRLFDGRRVVLENRIHVDVVEALRKRGHDIDLSDPFTMQCGGMQAVARDPSNGALSGAADPRRDGVAIGV